MIGVLNEIYAAPLDRSFSSVPTLSQRESQHQIFKQLSRLNRYDLSCKEREAVLEELLHSSPVYGGMEHSTVRVFDRALVSIPKSSSEPIPLAGLLDQIGRDTIEDASNRMLVTEDEWGQIIEQNQTFPPYMDETLRASPQEYVDFIKDMYDAGMLGFTSKPQGLVTPFFVAKKDGRQRLILDCRGVNRRFRPPPAMSLAAGYSWGQLRLPSKSKLFVAQSDIKDYFYSLAMPKELQTLFSLPGIPAELLRSWNVPDHLGGDASSGGETYPCLRVVPMGWSWAMWIAQRVHTQQCLVASGLGPDRLIHDKSPAPDLDDGQPVLIPYADNLNVAGINKSQVQEVKDRVVKHLRHLGFKVHEELDACSSATSLGYHIDGETGIIQPVPHKLSKVQFAFRWLSKRPRVTGKLVQKLIGHAVHFMMVRRELLSLFRNLYDFAIKCEHVHCRLWRSACREARWVSVLLSLCSTDLRAPWCSSVTASDASLSGIAVCKRDSSIEDVSKMGSQREAWRFKGSDPKPAPRRQTVQKLDVLSDVATVKPSVSSGELVFSENQDFKEIPQSFLKDEDWQLCVSAKMSIREHITLLEGRGIVAALRHKLRNSSMFGKRHLHLNDNLAAVLITDKGRTSSPSMLRVSRRITALLLASGCLLVPRWIPSEWNVADKGSRRWEAERREEAKQCSGTKKLKEALIYPKSSRTVQLRSDKAALFPTVQGESIGSQFEHSTTSSSSSRQEPSGAAQQQTVSVFPTGEPTTIPWTDPIGAEGGIGFSCTRLCSEISRIPPVLSDEWDEPSERDQIRRSLLHLSESHVHGRSRHQRGQQGLRQRPGRAPGLRRKAEFDEEPTSSSGLDQDGSGKHPATTGLGSHCQDRHVDVEPPTDPGGLGHHPDVCVLPQTGRGSAAPRGGPGSSGPWAPALCSEPTSGRPPRRIQGRTSGRNHSDRLSGGSKPRTLPSTPADRQQEKLPPEARVPATQEGVGLVSSGAGSSSELCSALSAEAFRSFARSIDELSSPERCEEAWEVASRFITAALRSSRSGGARVPEIAYPDSGGLQGGRDKVPAGAPKVLLPTQATDKKKWVVEVFSGSCHLSAAAVKAGYRVLSLDILYGTICDVLSPSVRQALREFVTDHQVVLVWFGMPCQSWSRARKWDGGPPPLRDDADHLWGYPDLSKTDADKVFLGNRLLQFTAFLINMMMDLSIPWVLENPWTSRAWLTPPMKRLLAWDDVSFGRLDFCQYHMPWRKATGLMYYGINLQPIMRTCTGISNRCSASGRRHIVLEGKDSANQWWTHRAQPYPEQLCIEIIQQL